jgi:hypothetical protein
MRYSLFWDVTQHRCVVSTNILGHLTSTIFRGQIFQGYLTLTFGDGTGRLSQNVGNYQSKLCKIPEE